MDNSFPPKSRPDDQASRVCDDQLPRPYKAGIVAELIDLDRDIMKLLARRAKLVGKLRGGKDHAATPTAAKAEKEVRSAWEKNSVSFSRDDKFARQLFALLQELRVDSRQDAESRSGFNLAPARKPVAVALLGPLSGVAARMLAVVAACSGGALSLQNVFFSDPLIDCVKALNSTGAGFSWKTSGRAGEGTLEHVAADVAISFAGDKALYVGEDLLNMYLMAFLTVGNVGKARFAGGAGLKMADLSPLRRFLPELGARMAHSVPKSVGLPAGIESSGIVPSHITVPADLPKEGVMALIAAAVAWRRETSIECGMLPEALLAGALAECLPVLQVCSTPNDIQGTTLRIDAREAALPQPDVENAVALDSALCAYLLALPAFAGGSVFLSGRWDASHPCSGQVFDLIRRSGADVCADADGVRAMLKEGAAPEDLPPLDLSRTSEALLPLGVAFAVKEALRKRAETPLPALPDFVDLSVVEGFCARLGVICHGGVLLPRAKDNPLTEEGVPWTSPAAEWSLAYALCSFERPNVLLANPASVNALMPSFWALFNALPNPAESKKVPEKPQTRRRIIAS